MLITVQSDEYIHTVALPDEVRGAYWVQDAQGERVAFVQAEEAGWRMEPAQDIAFVGSISQECLLIPFEEAYIFAVEGKGNHWTMICRPATAGDKTTRIIGFSQDERMTIGRSQDNIVEYPSRYVSSHHAVLTFFDGTFSIRDLCSSNGVFLNTHRIPPDEPIDLNVGDTVTILGLRLTIGDRFISLNCPEDILHVKEAVGFVPFNPPEAVLDRRECHSARHCFYPALRFARSIEPKEFVIDAPPQREQEDDAPIGMRIGPSLAMAMASILSASVSVMFVMEQNGSILRAVPMLAMAVAMLAGSVLWPILNKRFQHTRHEQKEAQRRSAYAQYLEKMRSQLLREAQIQKDILLENRLSPRACLKVAAEQDAHFMSRMPLRKDYLEIRLGRGRLPLAAHIRFPDIRFELQEDDLRDAVDAFAHEPHILSDVPLGHSLMEKPVIGLVGSRSFTDGFLRNILIQLCALHSCQDVKVALLADEHTVDAWMFARHIPHLFSDDKAVRFFAASLDEANALGMPLGKVLEGRFAAESLDVREVKPYIVLLCPSKTIYDRSKIVKDVLACKDNVGFAVIACAEHMHDLPMQCRTIIGEHDEGAYLLDRDDPTGTRNAFTPDPPLSLEETKAFALDVAKVRIDVSESAEQLPDRLSFLQMLGIGNVDHLNVADRWRENNASDTLACPIGVDAAGDPFILDLHEDFHGPHGLIAGTTGSGKSEFIITYVLSMALNYSPDDVAFVLIDYKGGGLAKAFDNDRFRLPHIAGTVTNLDGSAISRSLTSIQSELRRRQQLFNEAREVLGGDNVDIYKYLDLFRQGKVQQPCPHLILIADEFAELKQQEPEFMDELISASRIGRSLGVHLVLATQKPSGVVNDQIWSNSRFKIALKVADAADSKEIIKRPDAAEITQSGRFFLLVGYNELFNKGQSGYSGVPYVADLDPGTLQDQGISYISNTGRPLLSVKPQAVHATMSSQSQIVAVSECIVQVAAAQQRQAQLLWLPPLPPHIQLLELERRFDREGSDDLALNPVVGAYDDPAHQSQGLLRLPLMKDGNALIYGSVDAGVEQAVRTLLFSALHQHTAQTLNAYILDLGSQSLSAFACAPQVGDVVVLGEDEKMKRFFGFMHALIVERRTLFAQQGGSFVRYRERVGSCPAILIVINGVAAFLDAYPNLEEELVNLARESAQAGMYIVAVAETPNAVRIRLKSHFRQVLACDLPDPSDYAMLFGSLHGAVVPHGYGRGLVKIDDALFEFQIADLCTEHESEYDVIVAACSAMQQSQINPAPSIPMPPDRVTPKMLADAQALPSELPYGIYDDALTWASIDLAETALSRVVYLKAKTGTAFIGGVVDAWVLQGARDIVMLDLAHILTAQPQGCTFSTRKDEFAVQYLTDVAERGVNQPTVILISGVMGFLGRCSLDAASVCKSLLKSLVPGGSLSIVLFDSVNDAGYTYEDWFRAHTTNRDGIWIGPGIEGQNAIGISYDRGLLPDAKMGSGRGYVVEGGACRLVHTVTATNERSTD